MIQNLIATFSVQYQIQTKLNREAVDASLEQAFEQSALMNYVPAHGCGVGTSWSLKFLPTPTIPRFYEIYLKKKPP